MTKKENHRISTVLVAIAAVVSVLVVSTSAISGHIALAQTNSGSNSNSGVDISQSNTATGTCDTAGGSDTITNSCHATQINNSTNTGGVH